MLPEGLLAAGWLLAALLPPPQAARDNTIAEASSMDKSFFTFYSSISDFAPQQGRLPPPKGLFYCKTSEGKSQYAQNNFLNFVENWLFCEKGSGLRRNIPENGRKKNDTP